MEQMHGFFLLLANLTQDKVEVFFFSTFGSFCFTVKNSLSILKLGLQKDSGDARAFSFLQILELMQFILHPPSMLFVENVVGFEVCYFVSFVLIHCQI